MDWFMGKTFGEFILHAAGAWLTIWLAWIIFRVFFPKMTPVRPIQLRNVGKRDVVFWTNTPDERGVYKRTFKGSFGGSSTDVYRQWVRSATYDAQEFIDGTEPIDLTLAEAGERDGVLYRPDERKSKYIPRDRVYQYRMLDWEDCYADSHGMEVALADADDKYVILQ